MASEFGSYVGRLISVRSVVQLYPGPYVETVCPVWSYGSVGAFTFVIWEGLLSVVTVGCYCRLALRCLAPFRRVFKLSRSCSVVGFW